MEKSKRSSDLGTCRKSKRTQTWNITVSAKPTVFAQKRYFEADRIESHEYPEFY
jgi:hypothetical protein